MTAGPIVVLATVFVGWTPKTSCAGAAGLTTMPDWAPVIVGCAAVSVARIHWVPAVSKVAVNCWMPSSAAVNV